MKIRLIGQSNDSGVGTHFYNYTQALQSIAGISQFLEVFNFDDASLVRLQQESEPNDINISFVGMDMNRFFKGFNINWGIFESTVIPLRLLEVYKSTYLWIPSEWGRNIAQQNGVSIHQTALVPEGVDSNLYHPYFKPTPVKPFRFLLVGKYEIRKGYDEVLQAFSEEYGNNPDFELVIKSDHFKNHSAMAAELTEKIKNTNANNIDLRWGLHTTQQLANLYRSANVFLFPTKAEGWGLPIIEAAACGLPIITTFYSGHTEFLQHIKSSCVFVPYQLEPISCPIYKECYESIDGNYGKWAVSSVEDIKKAMRTAYSNYESLNQQAFKNSTFIRNNYSWTASVNTALNDLKRLGVV